MKCCSICQDVSPDDALFCIGCGLSFGAIGATQRMSSAGVPTQALVNEQPSSMASAMPIFSMGTMFTLIDGSAGAFFVHSYRYGYGVGFGSAASFIVVECGSA